MFLRYLRGWRSDRNSGSRRRASFRPGLENLEDRTVPSLFTSAREVPSAPGPNGVVVGDFNQDGFDDFATAGGGVTNPQVSVHLGNGAGQFHEPSGGRIPVGKNPGAIVAADFDGDGWPDLVVASSFSSTVTFLHGHQNSHDGNFTPVGPPSPTGGTNPTSLAVADFDGDRKLDLAVTNFSNSTVAILHGNGNGSFTVVNTFTFFPSPSAVTAGDFDGDERIDLAVANSSPTNTVELALNQQGGWKKGVTVPVGRDPLAIAAADVNGDGKLDLMTANQFDDNVSVLLGTGGTEAFQPAVNYAVGHAPHALAVADFNRDKPLADFNADGKLDLAVAVSGGVAVLEGDGHGAFQAPGGSPFPAANDSLGLAVGNFDVFGAMGLPDLVETDFANDRALVLFNLGHEQISLVSDHPSRTAGFSEPVTFTVQVLPSISSGLPPGDPGVPSGTATFFFDGLPAATVPLVGGKASFTTAALLPGTHQIHVTYNGDDTRGPDTASDYLTVTDTADLTGPINPVMKHKRSGSQLQRARFNFFQKVTLVNTSGLTLRGPLWLALDGLSRRVKVRHRAGLTVAHGTRHSPYVAVPLPGGVLAAGAEVTVALQLMAPPGQKVRFRPLVLAGIGIL